MKKIFEGTVISNKMQNTVVVEVVKKRPHPLYRKLLLRGKKYKADNGEFSPHVGDKVRIEEVRPLSKDKHFKISQVLNVKQETGGKKT